MLVPPPPPPPPPSLSLSLSVVQVGVESARTKMLLELLVQIVREPCFDTLRTKEQLGKARNMVWVHLEYYK